MSHSPRNWIFAASLAVALLASLCALWCGMRSYRTFVLLQSAYELGMPNASSVRAWMTLQYVASSYRIPEDALVARLDLPPVTPMDTSLRAIAEQRGMTPFQFVQQVQRLIAEIAPPAASPDQDGSRGWFDWLNDRILAAVLRYGYVVLGLTFLLGAIGLPLPTGLAAALAGSLAASGQLDWFAAGALATAASVLGDAVTYAVGRSIGEPFLARRGRWLGLSAERQKRARALFEHWGAWTVLITRTLVSHLSSVVSLLAGLSHYRLVAFLSIALLGRLLWTAAYMGLGYGIGGQLEYATDFLKNLSLLLVSVVVIAGSMLIAAGRINLVRHARPS